MSKLNSLKSENLPSTWRLLPVGKVLLDTQYGTNEPAIDGGNTKVVGMKDIQDGKVLTDDLSCSNLSDVEREHYLLNNGDLLINRTNSYDLVGKVGIFTSDEEIAFASYLVRLAVDRNQACPEYLNHCLNGYVAQTVIKKIATRAISQANVNPTEFKKHCLVPLPPLPEQTAIANLLAAWDLAIEKAEQLIATKERRLSSLTQDLLTGKKRINGFTGKWQNYRLAEVLIEHREASTGREEVYSVSVHKGLINQIEHLGRVFAAKDTSNYNLVKPGDVVYTKSPTGNFPYGIIKQSCIDFPVIVSPLYGVFTPRSQQLGTFLNFYFESPVRTRNYLWPIIQKGAKNTINITNSTFLSNSLYLPSCDEETEAIAALLTTARQEIDLLKRQAEAWRRQKRGLMQRLLTGQWRVKTVEATQ